MSDKAPTGELKFGSDPTGLFIAHEDLKTYMSALDVVRRGRPDAMSEALLDQLMQLMDQAADGETTALVQVCKSFDDCRITTAVLDKLVRT